MTAADPTVGVARPEMPEEAPVPDVDCIVCGRPCPGLIVVATGEIRRLCVDCLVDDQGEGA